MNLPGRQRRVRRDVDGGGSQNGHVRDKPIDAVFRDDANAIARRNAALDERGGNSERFGSIAFPGDIMPDTITLETEGGTRTEPFGLAAVDLDEIACVHGIRLCLAPLSPVLGGEGRGVGGVWEH